MARKKSSGRAKRTTRPKKRAKPSENKIRKIPLPVISVLGSFLVLALISATVWFYMFRSGVFTIESIVINKPQGDVFSGGEEKLRRFYTGRNIFSVDLIQIEALIRNEYPQIRNVEVKRRIPNVLEVDIKYREPFAYLDTAGGIVMDRDGMVLSSGDVPEGIVKILGISFFFTRPSTGSRIDNAMLDKALDLIDALRRAARLTGKEIDHIDVSDRNNLVVRVRGVNVNMGADGFTRKIEHLRAIIGDPAIKMEEIRYIDLRFRDPVISPR